MKKKQQFISQVGSFLCELVGRPKSCGFNARIFSDFWRYKPGFYFSPYIRYK